MEGCVNGIGPSKFRIRRHLPPPFVSPECLHDFLKLFLEEEDLARTVHAMGTSLLGWVQEIFRRGLFADDARVFGLTSEGNEIAWKGYAAAAAAKVAALMCTVVLLTGMVWGKVAWGHWWVWFQDRRRR